jgi:diadenylate cyclase
MISFWERLGSLQFTWRDAVDILVVAFILYGILALIRGTRAMQISIGLALLGSTFFIAQQFDLPALEAISREILFYLPFAIIVLFQHEIRRGLARMGGNPLLRLVPRTQGAVLEPVLDASFLLAARRIGALIVIEQTQSLREYVDSGKPLDALLSAELLANIFTPGAPLHDGAAIIQGNRIAAAGAFLPLPNDEQPIGHGTRHRAALGLTEETDAFVIVISEENGSVAAAYEGHLTENLDRAGLAQRFAASRGGLRGAA